jgi:hypothetical protein
MKLTNHEWMRAGVWMGLLLLVVCLMEMDREAHAQAISTTTVQGTVYLANGQPGTGTLVVSWPSFTTASGQLVAADSTTVAIAPDGFVSVNLAPNQGATPAGQYYTAVFYLSDGTTNTGYWVVPAVAEATLGQVQAQLMPSAQAVQAVSKAYVDQAIASVSESLLTASGGTLSGPLTLSGDPTQPLQAADKHYVDETFSQAAPLTGAAFTGPVSAPSVSAKNSASIGPRYDVTQYGAVGNGSTDDTAAVQAAFNACYNGGVTPYGGVVEFPGNKTYVVSSTINAHNSCQVEGVVGNYTVANAPPKLLWGGAAAGTVSTITAFSIASGVGTFTASNSLTAGQFVDIEGLATGFYLNRAIVQVTTASSTQFTAVVPWSTNVSSTSDSGTATTANVMLAFDSNARYQQSISNIMLLPVAPLSSKTLQVGAYFASRVDTGTHVLNVEADNASMYGFYFLGGGINVDFDKGWRCDGVGIACIYWRVTGIDNLRIANGTVDNNSGAQTTASGGALMLDDGACHANDSMLLSSSHMDFEVNSTITSGLGVYTFYNCPSNTNIETFFVSLDANKVGGAGWYTAGFNFPTLVMSPPNDAALGLTIINGELESGSGPNTSPRWVGLTQLSRDDPYGYTGRIPLLSYSPSMKSAGASATNYTPSSLIGDVQISQLWQHKVQASTFLFSDTAFAALPNGTTLYAGQIIAPPTYWVGTAGKRYAINVVSQSGTTGTPNSGSTTCTGTTGGVLTCNSATDLTVGQRFAIGTDTNKTITEIDATNPSAVLVYTGWLSQNYTTATALSFSAPVLGLEVQMPTKSAAIPTALAWSQGDTLQNSGAVANGIAGWVNVAAGTPGTWAGIPLGNASGLLNLSQIFGTSSTSPVCPNGTGGTLTTVGCATGSSGVASINSTTGAFTFTGAGVSCTTTTCTFTGGTGSGTVQSGTAYSPTYYPSGGGAVVAGVTPFTGLAWYTTSAAPAQATAAQIVGAIGSTAVTNATNAANLSNGAVGSVPYQSGVGATAFTASPTTSGHTFVHAWQPSGSAIAPTAVDANSLNVATAANFTTPITGPVMGNGASAPSAATSHNHSAIANCVAASGSGTAYTCSTAPTFTPASGDHIQFKADVANTGAATLAVNGATAASIYKWGNSSALVANDLLAGHWISATYDGSHWQLEGQLGNSTATALSAASALPAGTTATTQTAGDNSTKLATTAYVATAVTYPVANTTFTTSTASVAANTCNSTVQIAMTGVTTSMVFLITPSADTSAATGWGGTGGLVLDVWPTAGYANIKICNQTAASITPTAVTFNVGAR